MAHGPDQPSVYFPNDHQSSHSTVSNAFASIHHHSVSKRPAFL